MPFGVQLVGRPFAEPLPLQIGRASEHETNWPQRRWPGL
jgi:Asp-tRNA(Asn)/Glu-tRNA(Gln) amidotransferase A subunit family amidase